VSDGRPRTASIAVTELQRPAIPRDGVREVVEPAGVAWEMLPVAPIRARD
jgi:hypothetical protein